MAYNVSTMIGIRTGGVFSGETDMEDMKARIQKVLDEQRKDEDCSSTPPALSVSRELTAGKGCYVVIAGVFNYWHSDESSKLAAALSVEFGVEVMWMSWDEETDGFESNVFLGGKPLRDVGENPVARTLRRVC